MTLGGVCGLPDGHNREHLSTTYAKKYARQLELHSDHNTKHYARQLELHPDANAEKYARRMELHPDHNTEKTLDGRHKSLAVRAERFIKGE